jgi:hypothetical protein
MPSIPKAWLQPWWCTHSIPDSFKCYLKQHAMSWIWKHSLLSYLIWDYSLLDTTKLSYQTLKTICRWRATPHIPASYTLQNQKKTQENAERKTNSEKKLFVILLHKETKFSQ